MALTRGCAPALLAALAGHFHPAILTEADHPDGLERCHSGAGVLTWNGHPWAGLGRYVALEVPEEAMGLATADASLRVAAPLETMLAERGKAIRGRAVTVRLGITTQAAGNVLVAGTTPIVLFAGTFDDRRFTFSREGEDFAHDMVLGLSLGPGARTFAAIEHGAEDQQRRYPGDTAGRHVINAVKRAYNPQLWPE